jgi:putative nucleotide binding protein
MEKRRYEEVAYALDFLPRGKAGFGREFIADSVVQMIGEDFFTLLEATVRPDVTININEKLYIGKETRDKVNHILGRIAYEKLTSTAKSELPVVVEMIVKQYADKYVQFFNSAQAVTPRMHAFELLPGIGKKYMWHIVNQRERKPFQSFQDIQERTEIPDPMKAVVKRIIEELTNDQKYRLFTRQT